MTVPMKKMPRMKVQLVKQIQTIINRYVVLSLQVQKIRSTGSIVIVVENVKRSIETIDRIVVRERQIVQLTES